MGSLIDFLAGFGSIGGGLLQGALVAKQQAELQRRWDMQFGSAQAKQAALNAYHAATLTQKGNIAANALQGENQRNLTTVTHEDQRSADKIKAEEKWKGDDRSAANQRKADELANAIKLEGMRIGGARANEMAKLKQQFQQQQDANMAADAWAKQQAGGNPMGNPALGAPGPKLVDPAYADAAARGVKPNPGKQHPVIGNAWTAKRDTMKAQLRKYKDPTSPEAMVDQHVLNAIQHRFNGLPATHQAVQTELSQAHDLFVKNRAPNGPTDPNYGQAALDADAYLNAQVPGRLSGEE